VVKRIILASWADVQWHNALTLPARSHGGVNAFNLCYILTLRPCSMAKCIETSFFSL